MQFLRIGADAGLAIFFSRWRFPGKNCVRL